MHLCIIVSVLGTFPRIYSGRMVWRITLTCFRRLLDSLRTSTFRKSWSRSEPHQMQKVDNGSHVWWGIWSKSDFTKECPLRGYDNRKEDWPKCMHGEDCLLQMFTERIDGGRRFFKCPRAWVIAITFHLLNMFLDCTTTYKTYLLQSSKSKENYGFTRWVDPRPIYPHQQYIYYL